MLPEFHKCVLVGDNFFLDLAVKEMGFRMVRHEGVLQSGYCASGQTIEEATQAIESIGCNQMILLNVGSIDIANGKELIEMIQSMSRLMKTCKMNNIVPILTTLPPLSNYRFANRSIVTDGFNEFLMKNPYNFPVVQLHNAFTNRNGIMDQHFYQQTARFVSGTRKSLVLWNRAGCQRIMRSLAQQLGTAVLSILLN